MYGTRHAAQCYDVVSENAKTAMAFTTSTFSPSVCHSSASDMSVFRHGDDFVVLRHTNTTEGILGTIVQTSHRQAPCNTGTVHSTWRRHSVQHLEQDCEMGQTFISDQDVNRVLRSGEGNANRTWSSLDAQRSGS